MLFLKFFVFFCWRRVEELRSVKEDSVTTCELQYELGIQDDSYN